MTENELQGHLSILTSFFLNTISCSYAATNGSLYTLWVSSELQQLLSTTLWPLYRTICASQLLQSRAAGFCWSKFLTALLTASSKFGLGRRCYSSFQWCYLHRLYSFHQFWATMPTQTTSGHWEITHLPAKMHLTDHDCPRVAICWVGDCHKMRGGYSSVVTGNSINDTSATYFTAESTETWNLEFNRGLILYKLNVM